MERNSLGNSNQSVWASNSKEGKDPLWRWEIVDHCDPRITHPFVQKPDEFKSTIVTYLESNFIEAEASSEAPLIDDFIIQTFSPFELTLIRWEQ